MSRCHGCGGVIGRDCFNQQECEQITRDMAASSLSMYDQSVVHDLREKLASLKKENERLEASEIKWFERNAQLEKENEELKKRLAQESFSLQCCAVDKNDLESELLKAKELLKRYYFGSGCGCDLCKEIDEFLNKK